ncbi:APOBEC1 complementation factor-like [Dendronephthya gigantea]|uniref:APOBEC1 complementation factor-like n=1 Tax=Dendronephthya gigantea TaxID=151771 RepID=UPI001069AF2F|nr:APOBEC1 complementation factor-like [Dendronephthya gigantea]
MTVAESGCETNRNMEDRNSPGPSEDGVTGTPNEAALRALMKRTGCPIRQSNGQRRFGPPPDWSGEMPPRGCEVFVGKIPRDVYEDELVPIFETVGKIYEIRLMMDFDGRNRGYAFVVYTQKKDAQDCIKKLNNYEIRRGKMLGVCSSVDNCRLFVGGIPKKVKKNEIMEEISKVTENVVDVIVYPSASDKTKNRGFAFVEYESHRAAAMARRKLMTGRVQLWGHPIAVDWAEPEAEVDEDIMSQVKVLYVRNLLLSTTEETIEGIFSQYGEVERVKKLRDYCFVHFKTREEARKAINGMKGQQIENSDVEVTLAKPVDKEQRQQRAMSKAIMAAGSYNYPNPPDYVIPYNGPSYPYTVNQPLYPFPTPMSSPQLIKPRGRGRTAAGSRAAGGRNYLFPCYHPGARPFYVPSYEDYTKKRTPEDHLYDLLPGMELTPTNPITLKPQKSSTQVLEDFCLKNNWGNPVYTLHSTQAPSTDMQLFVYKVNIPALPTLYQPQKLCRSVEEAKAYAAEYVLQQIGIPFDGPESPVSSVAAVVTTASPYVTRPVVPVTYAVTNGRAGESAGYPGFMPLASPTSPVLTKVPGAWPGGVPPSPDQNGVYGGFEGYGDPQYSAGMYAQY